MAVKGTGVARAEVTWPKETLWGAATSPHQVEGANVASDWWGYETMPSSPLPERSGDACDSYHRWPDDMDLVRGAGLNAYRFGIEWARVQPEPDRFDDAAIDHYRQMLDGARQRGLHPVVTTHHFTHPAWFAARGGWLRTGAVSDFVAYIARIAPLLHAATAVVTINEPNMLAVMHRVLRGEAGLSSGPGGALPLPDDALAAALIEAHRAAAEVIRSVVPTVPVGFSVASQVVRCAPGGEEQAEHYRDRIEDQFIRAAATDDFLGIQAYTRTVFGPKGKLPADHEGASVTETGWEFYPPAVAEAVDDVRVIAPHLDLLITENGIATDDDSDRIRYVTEALDELGQRGQIGASSIRGYLHWSLLDNYEWGSWRPRFGLVEVDRDNNFARTPKPSLRVLGEYCRAGAHITRQEQTRR